MLDSPFPQPLSRSSLVYLLVWNPLLHTPYISSNHYLRFSTHAQTITTCFAVEPRLCHLFLISHSAHYLEISYLNATHPFSYLFAELQPHFLSLQDRSHFRGTYCFAAFCQQPQLLYYLHLVINDTSLLVSSGKA